MCREEQHFENDFEEPGPNCYYFDCFLTQWVTNYHQIYSCTPIKVHLTPKYFFCLNKSLHLFEMHCTFKMNLDFFIGYKSYEI